MAAVAKAQAEATADTDSFTLDKIDRRKPVKRISTAMMLNPRTVSNP